MITLTGFTDEAGSDLETQINVTQELGWDYLSARTINGKNLHDLDEASFERVAAELDSSQIKVAEFGSLIGSWGKKISSDWELTVGEIERAIPRMQRLGTNIVRVMSYAQEPWGEEQYEQERFRRLREIVARFTDQGLTVAHENCMNWGGFSADHTLRLIDEVPGLKLLFDTGNPVFQLDRSLPDTAGKFPWQKPLEFFHKVKQHVVHVHVKDCIMHAEKDEPEYVWAGSGQGDVKQIIAELIADDYDGFIAIEPHVATIFHDLDEQNADQDHLYQSYLEYGQRFENLVNEALS